MKHALLCDPLRDFGMEVSKTARGPHVQKREGLRGKASREEDDNTATDSEPLNKGVSRTFCSIAHVQRMVSRGQINFQCD